MLVAMQQPSISLFETYTLTTILIINRGKTHGQSYPFVQKLTPLEGLNRPRVKSAFVLKSQG